MPIHMLRDKDGKLDAYRILDMAAERRDVDIALAGGNREKVVAAHGVYHQFEERIMSAFKELGIIVDASRYRAKATPTHVASTPKTVAGRVY